VLDTSSGSLADALGVNRSQKLAVAPLESPRPGRSRRRRSSRERWASPATARSCSSRTGRSWTRRRSPVTNP